MQIHIASPLCSSTPTTVRGFVVASEGKRDGANIKKGCRDRRNREQMQAVREAAQQVKISNTCSSPLKAGTNGMLRTRRQLLDAMPQWFQEG
jgi:hypothetical protein